MDYKVINFKQSTGFYFIYFWGKLKDIQTFLQGEMDLGSSQCSIGEVRSCQIPLKEHCLGIIAHGSCIVLQKGLIGVSVFVG